MTTQLATHTLCRMSTRRQKKRATTSSISVHLHTIYFWIEESVQIILIEWMRRKICSWFLSKAWERRKYWDMVGEGWRMCDGGVRQKQQKNNKKTNMLSIGVIYTFLVESSVNWVRTTTKSSSYLEWITLSFFWLQCWNFQLEINSQANDDAQL